MWPKVNDSIIIGILEENRTYVSTVAEVRNEELLITYPIGDGEVKIISLNTPIDISFISNGNRFRFHSQIIGRTKDVIPLYRIQKPKEDEIVKVQNRDNFRVQANLKVRIKQRDFTTINISGGGILFRCPSDFELEEGEKVSGSLFIPTSSNKVIESIQFEAKVVRVSLQDNSKHVGIAYTAIVEKQRQKVIQYCFLNERKDRLMKRE